MEQKPIYRIILDEINRMYKEQHIDICVGCKNEHTASCTFSDNAPCLCLCSQQLAKYKGL